MSQALLALPKSRSLVANPRRLAIAELALGVGLLELDLWALRESAPTWVRAIVYAALVGVVLISRSRRGCGAATAPPRPAARRAWSEAAIVTAALVAALLLASSAIRAPDEGFVSPFASRDAAEDAEWALGKLISAGLQQFALQGFLWPLCLIALRSPMAAIPCAAGLFGLIHLPSPALAAITFLAGCAWIALYRRSGRVAPLIASHALLASLAHAAIPERLHYDMQVGISAYNEMDRFASLRDPSVRCAMEVIRRNRESLKELSSAKYYAASGGTDAAFLDQVAEDVLGRPADTEESGRWAAGLASLGRVRVVADIMTQPDSRFVLD